MNTSSLSVVEKQIASEIRVNDQGQAYFSIRAVARLCDVSIGTLGEALSKDRLNTKKESKNLAKHLLDAGLDSDRLNSFSTDGIQDVCVALIVEYYAFVSVRSCTDQAKQVLRAFAATGIRAYSHKVTGWHKPMSSEEIQTQMRDFLLAQLPPTPSKWEPRYGKRFWDALERCYGLKIQHVACARVINAYIYGYFPLEVRQRLEQINPIVDGSRKSKQHQHFDDGLLKVLFDHIHAVTLLLETADDPEAFKRAMSRVKRIELSQLNLPALEGAK